MIAKDIHRSHDQSMQSINKSIIKLTTYTNSDQWFTIQNQ